MIYQILTAVFISAVIVSLAYWRDSLSPSGAVSALLVGILTFGLGGWVWGFLLGLFFVTSSLLSHFKEAEKRTAAEKFEKGHRRDAGQVLANGGLGALVATLAFLVPSAVWFPFFIGIMATVTADTWATELGTLAKRPPRLITSGRLVEVGTSGGISWLGTVVSLLGGLLIGLAAALFSEEVTVMRATFAGALAGLTGSLFDSLLGATVQQIYYCESCGKDTERKIHKCGAATRPLRGFRWLTNDGVNLVSSVVGGGTAVLLWLF